MPEPSSPLLPGRVVNLLPPASRGRLVFLGILAGIIVLGAFRHLEKASKLSRVGTQTKTAFLRWRTQILGEETPGRGQIPGLKHGDDIYRHYNYPNPPVMALMLWPLAELPPLVGALSWYFLKVGMAALALLWTFRLVGPLPDWARGLIILLSLHPILGDLSHGNVNIFITFLVLGSLEAYRRGWDLTAGLVLALAIACKVTPALFLPYFGWKWVLALGRAFPRGGLAIREAALQGAKLPVACLLGLVLWWLVVPGAVVGWERNLTWLESWYEGMVRPFVVEGRVTSEHANQSIPGLVYRLLTSEPSVIDYDEEDRPFGAAYHNLADIGPENARLVIRGCQAAWVLAVVLLAWGRHRQGVVFAAECALVVLGMLLFSERTWKHHAVTLMLPYAALVGYLATRPGVLRNVLIGLLGVVVCLTLGPSAMPEEEQDLALTYGTHTTAFLLLTLGVCLVMLSARDESRPSQ